MNQLPPNKPTAKSEPAAPQTVSTKQVEDQVVVDERQKVANAVDAAATQAGKEESPKAMKKTFWQVMKDKLWGDIHAPE